MFTRLVWSVVILIGLIVLMVGAESPLVEIQNNSVSRLYLQRNPSDTDVIMRLHVESVTEPKVYSSPSCVMTNQCANADIIVTVSDQSIVGNYRYCYSYSQNCRENTSVEVTIENDVTITLNRIYQPAKRKYQYKVDASCQPTTHLKYCPRKSRTWYKDNVSPTKQLEETYQCIPDSSPAEVELTIKPIPTSFLMAADVRSTHCLRVSTECLNTRSQQCVNRVRMNYHRICPNSSCLSSKSFVTPPNETLQIGFQYQQFDNGDTLEAQLSCSDHYKLNIRRQDAQQLIYDEPIILKIFSTRTQSERQWKHSYSVHNENNYQLYYEMISSFEDSLIQISCIPSVETTSTKPQTSPVSAITDTTTLSPDTVELTLVIDRVNETENYQPSLIFQSVGVPNVSHLTNNMEGSTCSDYIDMNPCPVTATNIRYRIEGQETPSRKCLTGISCNNSVSLNDTMYLSISRDTPATTNIMIRCKSSFRIQINGSNYERNVKLIMERNYNSPPSLFKTTVTINGVNNVTSYWNSAQQHRIKCVPEYVFCNELSDEVQNLRLGTKSYPERTTTNPTCQCTFESGNRTLDTIEAITRCNGTVMFNVELTVFKNGQYIDQTEEFLCEDKVELKFDTIGRSKQAVKMKISVDRTLSTDTSSFSFLFVSYFLQGDGQSAGIRHHEAIVKVLCVEGALVSSTTSSGSGGQTDSDQIGLIVGLTVSFLTLAVIITLIVIFIRKRRRRKESPQIQESVYSSNLPVNDTVEEGAYNVLHQRIPQNTEQIYADQEDNYQYSGIPDLQTVRYSPRREDRNSYHLVEFSSPTDNKNPRIHALNDNYDNTDDTLLKSGEPGITSAVVGLAGDVYSEVTKPSGGQEEQEIEMIENDIYEHAQTSDEEDCNYSLAHDI